LQLLFSRFRWLNLGSSINSLHPACHDNETSSKAG